MVITYIVIFNLGQLISNIVCLSLGDNWRVMLGMAAVLATIQLFGIPFLDESPMFDLKTGKPEEAKKTL